MKFVLSLIFFIYLNTFTYVYSLFKINPFKTNETLNLVDYYISFENYTTETGIRIEDTNEQVKFNGKSYLYSPNIFPCKNQINNEFLLLRKCLYKVYSSLDNIISASWYKCFSIDSNFIGYINQKATPNDNNCKISDMSVILYGINDNKIFFYFSKEEKKNEFSFDYVINTISCKLLDCSHYICAFDQDNKVKVIIVGFKSPGKGNYQFKKFNFKNIFDNSHYDKVILYDTNNVDRYKVLCATNSENYIVSCIIIDIDFSNYNIQFINFTNYNTKFIKNEDNCYLTVFNKEFLLCCGMNNQISCQRKNGLFETINNFNISIQDEIYNLTITNNINYAVISYMNKTSDPEYIYEYYIYPPKCPDFSGNILEEGFILFEKMTNTKYYIKFTYLPFRYGIPKINGKEIENLNRWIEIDNDFANFTFICFCNLIYEPNSLAITYNIYIFETYSKVCAIIFQTDNCFEHCIDYSDVYNNSRIDDDLEACEGDNHFILNGDCVSECPDGFYLFSLNRTCLTSCPKNYEANDQQEKCLLKSYDQTTSSTEFKSQISDNILELVNSSSIINGSDFIAVVMSSNNMKPKDQLDKGISAVDLGNCEQTLRGQYKIPENESLIILNMESKRNETENDKKNNDNSFNLGKTTQIEIYNSSGHKLNLSLCNDIKIMKYLGDVKEELNLDSAQSLSNQGIDVFNAQDSFFNDLCHKFDNGDGKDIILTDRRNELYQNVSFCEDGCSYSGMDYVLMTAICNCDSNTLQGEKNATNDNKEQSEALNFNTITKSFISNLLDFNIEVIYCYNLVFDLKRLSKNIGFFFMLIMILLQIIFFIVYLIKKIKPIKHFMFIFINHRNKGKYDSPFINNDLDNNNNNIKYNEKENNLSKNKKITENINSNKKVKFKINDEKKNSEEHNNINSEDILQNKLSPKNKNQKTNILNSQSYSQSELIPTNNITKKSFVQSKSKFTLNNNFDPNINYKAPIINIIIGKKNFLLNGKMNNFIYNTQNKSKNSNSKLEMQDLPTSAKNVNEIFYKIKRKKNLKKTKKNKALNNMETITENEYNKKINRINDFNLVSRINDDILDMDYEEAIIRAKISFIKIYWSYLVDSQIILGTFCTENYLDLFVIKLSFFVFTFEISFFLNALFYTDDYISDAYHNNGVLDFVSGLPKSIYSFIATLITTNLLRTLSSSKSELINIIRYYSKRDNYIYLINAKLKKLRIKIIIYFILVFLLEFCFLYYVTAFCAVYIYSQKYWFLGCLESFSLDTVVCVFLCLIVAFLRYIAIKRRLKFLYILSNIISTIL